MGKKKVKKVVVKKKKVTKKKAEKVSKKVKAEKVVGLKGDVAWSSDLSVGESNIDKQHQDMIEQIRKLEKNLSVENPLPGVRECIHFLDGYTKKHFTYEEAYMKKNKYPGLKKHQVIHKKFEDFYNKYKQELTLKLAKASDAKALAREHTKKVHEYLGRWLIEHIRKEDHKYCQFISPKTCGVVGKVSGKKFSGKKIDVSEIAKEIKAEQIKGQREPVANLPDLNGGAPKKIDKNRYTMTGVPGFDELLIKGIPQGSSIVVAGGAGSGKTIFCLQALAHHAAAGKKCLYMTFEEREERLITHMEDFGWKASEMIKKGNLKIQRMNPFDITRNVDALLAKQKGELLIDIDPVIIPNDFKPDFVVIDSLTAIASAFTSKEESYRIYIEQLFRFFEKLGSTNFLITETEQIPKIFSKTGVEEFLADGVIVIYNLKHGNVRENAIEILKLRGAAHQKKIVAMQITGEGIVVYPEQEVFSEIDSD